MHMKQKEITRGLDNAAAQGPQKASNCSRTKLLAALPFDHAHQRINTRAQALAQTYCAAPHEALSEGRACSS